MPSGAKCVIRCSPAVADVKGKPAQGTLGRRVARETTTAVAPTHTQKHAYFLALSLKDFKCNFDETRDILFPVRVNCKCPAPF